MIDGMPVIDAVVHAYNFDPSNYANKFAKPLCDFVSSAIMATSLPGNRVSVDGYVRDWSIEEVANMSFLEGYADLAVHHVLPIYSFKDGLCSLDKTLEAQRRWPDRFIVYAGVDPMEGSRAIDELDRQFELLGGPPGLKLYPNSWVGEKIKGWLMDDPEVAFPVFERAQKLGVKVIAIHKAVPLGPLPLEHYRMDDIDRAALAFPDLKFEVVHGGVGFLEETAFQLMRFPNVYVNLEMTTALGPIAPTAFQHAIATMIRFSGPQGMHRLMWGTGAMALHPRVLVESFVRDFQFDEQIVTGWGVPQMTAAFKRRIMAENYAEMIGLDLPERLARLPGDAFDRAGAERAPQYSTTKAAAHVC